jgi:hypothetical protein
MKDIYGVYSSTQKSKVYTAYSHFFKVPSIVTTMERKVHAVRRRISVRALTLAVVKGLEGLILKDCDIFSWIIGRRSRDWEADIEDDGAWGKGKSMTKLVPWLVSDIMGDVTFNRNWNLLRSEKNRHIVDVLSLGACSINTVSILRP